MVNGADFSRTTAAVICISTSRAELLGKRRFEVSIFVLRRIHDHLSVTCQVLFKAAALYVLELHHDHTRGRPFSQLVEAVFADNGIELVFVNEVGELVVLAAASTLHGLLEYLHRRIGERRLVEAERIDAGLLGSCLVLLQKLLDAWECHLLARYVEMIVHHAIDLIGKLPHQRGILSTDHRAAEKLRFEPKLPRRPNHAD